MFVLVYSYINEKTDHYQEYKKDLLAILEKTKDLYNLSRKELINKFSILEIEFIEEIKEKGLFDTALTIKDLLLNDTKPQIIFEKVKFKNYEQHCPPSLNPTMLEILLKQLAEEKENQNDLILIPNELIKSLKYIKNLSKGVKKFLCLYITNITEVLNQTLKNSTPTVFKNLIKDIPLNEKLFLFKSPNLTPKLLHLHFLDKDYYFIPILPSNYKHYLLTLFYLKNFYKHKLKEIIQNRYNNFPSDVESFKNLLLLLEKEFPDAPLKSLTDKAVDLIIYYIYFILLPEYTKVLTEIFNLKEAQIKGEHEHLILKTIQTLLPKTLKTEKTNGIKEAKKLLQNGIPPLQKLYFNKEDTIKTETFSLVTLINTFSKLILDEKEDAKKLLESFNFCVETLELINKYNAKEI